MAPLLGRKKKTTEQMDEENIEIEDNDAIEPVKKEKKQKKQKKENTGKKSKTGLIIGIILFLAFISFIFGIFKFNLFDIRDNYLRGFLEKVPIVNNILPPLETVDPVLNMTPEELLAKITGLESEIAKLKEENKSLSDMNSIYSDQVLALKVFEENQTEFKRDKEEFDKQVAAGNAKAYEQFYSRVSPENAEILYREVVGEVVSDKKFKNFVAAYQNMDESSAAKIFEEMVNTELDLVCSILENVDAEQRAGIVAALKPATAAQVTKRMSPNTP